MKFELGEIAWYVGNDEQPACEVEIIVVGPGVPGETVNIPGKFPQMCLEHWDYVVERGTEFAFMLEFRLRKIDPEQKYKELTRGRIHPKETPKRPETT